MPPLDDEEELEEDTPADVVTFGVQGPPGAGAAAGYVPGDATKWANPPGAPTTIQQALDRIAAVVGAETPIP